MLNLGTVKPGSTIYIPFDTFAGSTGASITLTGLAVGDIKIYKNGGTTERASTTGFTLLDTDGIDFDALTGIHGFSIDLSSNATADFYTAGARYFVVVDAVTIDSQTVRFIAATFDIGYSEAIINTTIATLASQTSFTLTAGPAEDDALNGCLVVIHDIASAVQLGFAVIQDYTGATKTVTLVAGTTFTVAAGDNISVLSPRLLPTTLGRTLDVSSGGEAGLDWANVGSQSTVVGLSGTTIKDATDVNTDTDALLSRMGMPSNLGGGATLSANLSDIEAQTDDIGAAGAGLTALASQASVNTIDDFLDTEIAAIKTVTDLLNTAQAEPTGAPAVNETPLEKIAYLFMALRNKITITASSKTFFDDGGSAEWSKTLSDDGTTYTEAEGL